MKNSYSTSERCRLILVRHGATEWSEQGRYQGHLPVALSPLGVQQAYAVAVAIKKYNPIHIISSDLKRAKQTTEIISQCLKIGTYFDPRLRELDCGEWAGCTEQEIENMYPQTVSSLRAGHDVSRGGAETLQDLRVRVSTSLTENRIINTTSTVIIVSHAYVISLIAKHLTGDQNHLCKRLPYLGSYTTLLKIYEQGMWTLEKYSSLPNETLLATSAQWLPTL